MFIKTHFDTEGPLGLPMKDAQAKHLETVLAALPREDRAVVRVTKARPPSEVMPGERTDVSWISTEELDWAGEIVVARGMNDSHFQLNPIVTMQHCYHIPPVGRSLWRKRARDGELVGIKAKTQYPARPQGWTDPWPADTAFALVQAGLLNGKSIGFLRLKSHAPGAQEIAAHPNLAGVNRIIDDWLLLEYSCVFLPCNQAALVDEVSKGQISIPGDLVKIMDLEESIFAVAADSESAATVGSLTHVPFMTEDEVRHMVRRRLAVVNPHALVEGAIDRARGRI